MPTAEQILKMLGGGSWFGAPPQSPPGGAQQTAQKAVPGGQSAQDWWNGLNLYEKRQQEAWADESAFANWLKSIGIDIKDLDPQQKMMYHAIFQQQRQAKPGQQQDFVGMISQLLGGR